jgi:hypothetical protein
MEGDTMKGFNPDQLVARGVFDSLAKLDSVMCELDDARPGPTLTRLGWGHGMDFNRARVRSGVGAMGGSNAIPFEAAPGSSMRASADVKQSALCIFCAWERAMQPGPRMAPPRINGDVRLEPCARHSSRLVTSNQQAAPASDAAPYPLPAA